jgi:hypothetical protein
MDNVYLKALGATAAMYPAVIPHLNKEAFESITDIKPAYKKGAAAGDISSINAEYHDAITAAFIEYFEGGGVAASRNDFKRATIQAFSDAFDSGWVDGGGELPIDDDAMTWIESRINEEFGFVESVFENAKELRKDKEFDYFAWATARADGYSGTLKEIYNTARLWVMRDIMVTFDGDDGAESCPDCMRLKGKRHKISWFIENDYVPPYGTGLECHAGGHCQHGLMDDKGNWITL